MVVLPSTYDNLLIKYLHINSIFKKGMFLKVKGGGGGGVNRPVQGLGSTCRFGARSECGQRVRSINRIAPQGSHRYSRRGHNTNVLHLFVQGRSVINCSLLVNEPPQLERTVINRQTAPQGAHRENRRVHNTIVLQRERAREREREIELENFILQGL